VVLEEPGELKKKVTEDEMGGPCSTNGGEEERL
jgi:hypothetical protein